MQIITKFYHCKNFTKNFIQNFNEIYMQISIPNKKICKTI